MTAGVVTPTLGGMIVEYIRYQIPSDRDEAFRAAYGRAVASLQASKHCLGYELARCEEEPSAYILRIHWTSTADHLQGFRRSPEFGPFLAEVRPFIEQIQEMRHYEPTELVWPRN